MKTIVISQPMLFPWVGMFEQVALADCFVYYDDVQFSKGSFSNRVQLKTLKGSEWMTIPLQHMKLGKMINQVQASSHSNWRQQHYQQLQRHYQACPYYTDMLQLVTQVYDHDSDLLAELTIASMNLVSDYYGLTKHTTVIRSSALDIDGKSSQRVLDVVLSQAGQRYVTGYGARKYLNHELFEQAGVQVDYMDYRLTAYTQRYGDFNPYVSVLDLIANMGPHGLNYILPRTTYWKDLPHE